MATRQLALPVLSSGDVGFDAQLCRAMATTGFVYLRQDPALSRAVMDAARWIFAASDAVKDSVRTGDGQRGFFEFEHAGGANDGIEVFNVCCDTVPACLPPPRIRPLSGPLCRCPPLR